jgi:histone deacetylase complex regulatory component SIN3
MEDLIGFDKAMEFLTRVKHAVSRMDYMHFLSLLMAYKKNKVDIERVSRIANQLMSSCPLLAKEFMFFLPDPVRNASRYTRVGKPFQFPVGTGIASLAVLPSKTGNVKSTADNVSSSSDYKNSVNVNSTNYFVNTVHDLRRTLRRACPNIGVLSFVLRTVSPVACQDRR